MFILSKTLGVLIVPPGLLLVLLATAIFLLLRNRKRASLYILSFTLVFLYLLSIHPFKDLLLYPLEKPFETRPEHPDCNAIVVLSGGCYPNSPEEGGNTSVSSQTMKRLYQGFKLYKKLKVPVVVSGGTVLCPECEPEAEAMKKVLVSWGVPESAVITEGKSRNTLENALFTGELLKKLGIKDPVCLVTSAYHMRRSLTIFSSTGLKAYPFAADFQMWKGSYNWYSFMPKASVFKSSASAIREYIGLIYFWIIQRNSAKAKNIGTGE